MRSIIVGDRAKHEILKICLLIVIILSVIIIVINIPGLLWRQTIALLFLSIETILLIFFWKYKIAIAFSTISALLFSGVIDVAHIIEFASFDVILFLISMMIIIGYLEEEGFFEHLMDVAITSFGRSARRLLLTIMLFSALLAPVAGAMVAALIATAMILHLAAQYKVDPKPFVLAVVFASNIGSSATTIGNPVGILIALRAGLTLPEFIRWAMPSAIISLAILMVICLKMFSSSIAELDKSMKEISIETRRELERSKLIRCSIVLVIVIVTIMFHHQLEELLHLERNTLILGIPIGIAGAILAINLEKGRGILEYRVDWSTLIFFALLFAAVGTLKYVGITKLIANTIAEFSGGHEINTFFTLSSVSAVLSAFMDNILAVATFIPVVHHLEDAGFNTYPLWWALLISSTYFGNMTIVAGIANMVAVGMLERRGLGHITFTEWMKYGIPVSVITLLVGILVVYVQIPLMP